MSLPDRPGSLLSVTKAIADAGCNIVDVEVLASAEGRAIDEFLVECIAEAPLRKALETVSGIQVLAMRRTMRLNGFRADLDLLSRLVGDPGAGLATAVELAPGAFHADFALALSVAGDETTLIQRSSSAPLHVPTGLPVVMSGNPRRAVVRPAPDVQWEVAGTPLGPHTLYVVRDGGPVFLQTELLHLRRIADLAATLSRMEAVALG